MPDLPEMTLEFTTIETKELLRMRAEIAALSAEHYSDTYFIVECKKQIDKLADEMDAIKSTQKSIHCVLDLVYQHSKTWRDKPESYWLARLLEEFGELGASLANDHEHPPEWELRQIAAIAINWLDMRAKQAQP